MKKQLKRYIRIWLIRVIVVVGLVLAAQHWGIPAYKQYFVSKKTSAYVPTTKVRKGPFVISFHEIGTLEAEKSVVVSTTTGGRIIKLVDDGIIVKPGDQLAIMDTTDIIRDLRTAQLAYTNAQAEVARANGELTILKETNKTEVEQAMAQYDFDISEQEQAVELLRKKTDLAKQKLVPGDQVTQAELQLKAKNLAVKKGELALNLKKEDVKSKEQQKQADIDKLKFAAAIAKSNLEEVEDRIKQATITAPTGGLVVISKTWSESGHRRIQEGDTVRPRQTICTLPDLATMLVKVQVGESDAPKLELGLPVLIRLEAVPKKVYHGSVRDISRLATEASPWEVSSTPGRKNFEVTIAVREVDPKTLNPGMTADVEFICDKVESATYVPLESVVEREGKTYVFVKEGNNYRRTEIKTGKQNDNFICVTKGIKEGQIIALRDPTKPLEEQEAGTAASEAGEKRKQPAPIPASNEKE